MGGVLELQMCKTTSPGMPTSPTRLERLASIQAPDGQAWMRVTLQIQGTVVEAFNSILALRPMDVSRMAVGCLAKGAQAYAKQRYGIAVRMRLLTC